MKPPPWIWKITESTVFEPRSPRIASVMPFMDFANEEY